MSLDAFCTVHVGAFLQAELKRKNGAEGAESERGPREWPRGQGAGRRRGRVGAAGH